jgi:hypothetical protein
MKKVFLRIFQREIKLQCEFAVMAYNDLVEALATQNSDRLWYSVQSFLAATGNISKLLFSTSDLPKRAIDLRQSLSVSDNSPLASREFRNCFEHFDARLEKWMINSRRHNFIDTCVGPPNMIGGLDREDYLRNFDTTNFAITFRGDVYNLKPIIEAIQELWKKAVIESQKWESL